MELKYIYGKNEGTANYPIPLLTTLDRWYYIISGFSSGENVLCEIHLRSDLKHPVWKFNYWLVKNYNCLFGSLVRRGTLIGAGV